MKIQLNEEREQGINELGWNIYFLKINDKEEVCALIQFKNSGYDIAFNFDSQHNFPPHSDEDIKLNSKSQQKLLSWIDQNIELFN